MILETKYNIGQKVWKLKRVVTHLISRKCDRCLGRGTLKLADGEDIKCDICKGRGYHYSIRNRKIAFLEEHTVCGVSVMAVKGKHNTEQYLLDIVCQNHNWQHSKKLHGSKSEAVAVARRYNKFSKNVSSRPDLIQSKIWPR